MPKQPDKVEDLSRAGTIQRPVKETYIIEAEASDLLSVLALNMTGASQKIVAAYSAREGMLCVSSRKRKKSPPTRLPQSASMAALDYAEAFYARQLKCVLHRSSADA